MDEQNTTPKQPAKALVKVMTDPIRQRVISTLNRQKKKKIQLKEQAKPASSFILNQNVPSTTKNTFKNIFLKIREKNSRIEEDYGSKSYRKLTRSVEAYNSVAHEMIEQIDLCSNPYNETDEDVKKTDTYEMLEQASRELRSIDYDLKSCIANGLENFNKLTIANSVTVEIYNQFLAKRRKLEKKVGGEGETVVRL